MTLLHGVSYLVSKLHNSIADAVLRLSARVSSFIVK